MRAIDADALKAKLMCLPGEYARSFAGKACLMAIDDTHTLDYAPIKHASWIRQDDTYTRFQCGECKSKNFDRRWVFCPLCGAKMKEDKDDGKDDA